MFQFAFLIGIYSYIIFALGILHLLNRELIFLVTIFYLFLLFTFKNIIFIKADKLTLLFKRNTLQNVSSGIKSIPAKCRTNYQLGQEDTTQRKHVVDSFLVIFILIQAGINLIGTLGPELGFDALWYHLTMPQIYLNSGKIFYIGGHLYYSAMPQLTEMYYLVSLALGNEIIAKLVHFLFGIFSLVALYKIARLFLSVKDSVLTALIFYSNLVVGWMSITAYIDLSRTFFETMALWAFLIFTKSKRLKWLSISAVMVGFAISTKVLSISSIILYLFLLTYLKFSNNLKTKYFLKSVIIFTGIAFITAAPWLLYSYFNTGNPVYPVFSSGFHPTSGNLLSFNLPQPLKQGVQIFLLSPDPISPIYAICLPLIVLYFWKSLFKKIPKEVALIINLLIIYVLYNIATLYLTPVESSGRYILPFLPGFTLLFLLLLKNLKSKFVYNFLFIIILLIAISSIAYRGIANRRFIPYLLGRTILSEFMVKNMEFHVGNFYDIDGYFQKTMKPDDKVLIYGISNLFYVNFPYIHQSWVKKEDKFNYILVKDNELPEKFKGWQLIYQNPLTKIKLYSLSNL